MSYYCPIWVPPPLKAGPHQGIRSSQIFASGPMAIAHPIKCWKAGPDFRMNICAAIFAHNEERRIGSCLKSLPLDRMDIAFHVLVNGSNDRTADRARLAAGGRANRSEEHTSELQSLMRISYAVFCLKKKHALLVT